MKIAIVLVARDADILAFFEERRSSVIPKTVMKNQDRCNAVVLDASCSDEDLIQFLLKMHANHDAVGVLIEAGDESRLRGCACAIFRKTFSPAEAKSKNSLQNYFGESLTPWLKNLLFMLKTFSEGKNRKCLMLPQHSFLANELNAIFLLCHAKNEVGSFSQSLEAQLKLLRGRSNPKTHQRDRNRKEYLVDDGAKHFELGKERDGRSETKRPPHVIECEFTASARFGVTMDRHLHFNVSLASGKKISGKFQNCHAGQVNQQACTHLNMFPNGFIR